MGRQRLLRLAEDFTGVAPVQYEELAQICWELAINELDVRFMVVRECLLSSRGFWGEGEGGAVSADFQAALRRIWESYLPGVLQTAGEDEGTTLALAMMEELTALGSSDPLTFRAD